MAQSKCSKPSEGAWFCLHLCEPWFDLWPWQLCSISVTYSPSACGPCYQASENEFSPFTTFPFNTYLLLSSGFQSSFASDGPPIWTFVTLSPGLLARRSSTAYFTVNEIPNAFTELCCNSSCPSNGHSHADPQLLPHQVSGRLLVTAVLQSGSTRNLELTLDFTTLNFMFIIIVWCSCLCVYLCVYTYMYVYLYVCLYVYMMIVCICMCVYMMVISCMCVYACIT